MQDTINTLREALLLASRQGHTATASPLYDEREMRSIIDLVIEEICGITKVDRLLHPSLNPTLQQREELLHCANLLAQGIPVQQALGYEWFCGRRFHVTPDVLIPRPETAELIDWICSTVISAHPWCGNSSQQKSSSVPPLRLLDMGTGSGCIAITLARLINNSQVLALDLSTEALSVARRNACEQGVDNVQFAHADILKCTDDNYYQSVINQLSTGYQQYTCHTLINTTFDVIVSNPPYICQHEAVEMSALVLEHEPHMALFVPDDDPLLFYRSIARFARHHLAQNGWLFFEINAAYGAETILMLQNEGFSQVDLRKDVTGRDRMVCAQNLAI